MSYLKYSVLAVMLSSTLVFTAPARASNCCNSFWSCLGAVATAGLSCAAEAAVNEIEEILQHARDLFNLGQRTFDASIGTLNTAVVNATRGATDSFASIERNSNAHRRQASEISTRVSRDYDPSRPQVAETARQATVRTVQTENNTASQPAVNRAAQAPQATPNAAAQAQMNRQISSAASEQIAATASTSGVSNTPSREEMQAAMRVALQRVNQLADKTGRDERSGFEDAMRGLERAHQTAVNHMRDVFSVSFAAPIGGVIGPLAATIVDPISFLITARTMNLTLDRAIRDLERLFPPAVGDANTQINNQMEILTGKITTATNTTSEAGRIVNAMAELERNPTRYYFAQLNDLTGHQSAPATATARGTSVTGTTVAMAPAAANPNVAATIDPALLRSLQIQFRPEITQQLSREMTKFKQESDRLQAKLERKQNTQQYEAQLDRYWDNQFRGKSTTEMDAKKRELMSEINRKFQKDPDARNKALQLLDQESIKYSALGQSSPAIKPAANMPQNTMKPIVQPNQNIKPMAPGTTTPITNPTQAPNKTAPIQTVPIQTAPIQTVPIQQMPVQKVPTQQQVPGQQMPSQQVPGQKTQMQQVPNSPPTNPALIKPVAPMSIK